MVQHSKIACLSKSEIFKNLPLSLKEKLVPISTHQEYFPKGSFIRQPLDGKDGMIVMDKGKAKVFSLNKDGKEVVLGMLKTGDIEGQGNLFTNDSRENFVQATQDTWICSMNRSDFQKMLQEVPDLAVNMLNDFGQRLVLAEKNTIRRNSLNAKDRVMDYLHEQSKQKGTSIFNLPLKKKDLASYLGISPETLSRQLKLLEKEDKIKVTGKKIEVMES